VPSGLLNFIAKIKQTDAYACAVFPKSDAVGILTDTPIHRYHGERADRGARAVPAGRAHGLGGPAGVDEREDRIDRANIYVNNNGSVTWTRRWTPSRRST
jgi:hypothetical protein